MEFIGEYRTDSAEETFELGFRIGESLSSTTVFLLEGDLGAGKTVLAKGLAAGIGIDPADVTSPTFTLINQYDQPEGGRRLYHLDLYRLVGDDSELRELGIDEICSEPGALVVIEWPERLGWRRFPNTYRIKILDEGGESRTISIVKSEQDAAGSPTGRTGSR
jgi:tRNA threonylcarbamoyladenosine biosynthesis protein TsaE